MAEEKNQAEVEVNIRPLQPGAVIKPGSAEGAQIAKADATPQTPPPAPEPKPEPKPEPQKKPEPAPPPPPPAAPEPPQSPPTPQPEEQQPELSPFAEGALAQRDGGGITWTASEFVAHEKDASWYALLGLAAVVVAAIIALLTKDFITSGVVIFCAIILGIYGARKPRQLQYRLDDSGVSIGQKHHVYEEFRSFAVVPEGAFSSIVFMPLKRFAPLTTIYYAPEDEEEIVDLLMDCLPFDESHTHDAVDQFMRRIRF
ncbi:MAG: hypothetical protein JWL89_577 [Candidatus Saccharibacteria bacterium]|nr:hypothetical protein [Candidatus Saccharibacteria bacterium]